MSSRLQKRASIKRGQSARELARITNKAIEGPIRLNLCLTSDCACTRQGWCPAHDVWVDAQAAVAQVLRHATIHALAARWPCAIPLRRSPVPHGTDRGHARRTRVRLTRSHAAARAVINASIPATASPVAGMESAFCSAAVAGPYTSTRCTQ